MNARAMVALSAASFLLLASGSRAQTTAVSPIQRATLATFASAGCLMLSVSRNYSAERSPEEIAAIAEKDCDREALAVPAAQVAAGVPNAKMDIEQARSAARSLAMAFAEQVRNATLAPVVLP